MAIVDNPGSWTSDPVIIKPQAVTAATRGEINRALKTFITPAGYWNTNMAPALFHTELDKIFPGTNSDTV